MIKGNTSISIAELREYVSDAEIISHYFGITTFPALINSPLRKENNPSFSFTIYNDKVYWKDFSTNEKGDIVDFFKRYWSCDYKDVVRKIYRDLIINNVKFKKVNRLFAFPKSYKPKTTTNNLQCKVRPWRKYDIEYWNSYGITLEWLKFAEVYPISHKFITKDGKTYTFLCDKYAYAYIEHKEGNTTIKIYQPFNKNGYKWTNKHDRSVISLWTKLPKCGQKVVICSSVKDALCLWCNTLIPAIAVQGEGYELSNTAISELKRRFEKIYICFDNDEAGLKDAELLSQKTGFTNKILPLFEGGKDISDFYKVTDVNTFKTTLNKLFDQ